LEKKLFGHQLTFIACKTASSYATTCIEIANNEKNIQRTTNGMLSKPTEKQIQGPQGLGRSS
jgi:hypothetical protein